MTLPVEYYGRSFFKTPQQELFDEITCESPRRQEILISLAEQQIEVQKDVAQEIITSNLTGAKIVTQEIAQQTLALEYAVQNVGKEVSAAGEQVSYAIERLGRQLSSALYEIKWQLAQIKNQIAQQNKIMKDILTVLKNNRNNEAQQFVRQGLRHYLNEEYAEAEERFKRGLDYDTTDYQILMNLAYIEIHKNNENDALKYFNKALSLPENLDNSSKSRTLWAISRLYYVQKIYDTALDYAGTALKLDQLTNPEGFFTAGVYAALDGKKEIALKYIHQAIQLNPDFFIKAAAETQRDLFGIKTDIFLLLSEISNDMLEKAKELSNTAIERCQKLTKVNSDNEYILLLDQIQSSCKPAAALLQNPSYSDCVKCVTNFSHIHQILPIMENMAKLYADQKEINTNMDHKKEKKNKLQGSVPEIESYKEIKLEGYIPIALCCLYVIPGFFVAHVAHLAYNGMPGLVAFLFWPLWFLLGFLGTMTPSIAPHLQNDRVFFPAGWIGIKIAIGIIIAGIIFLFFRKYFYKGIEKINLKRMNSILSNIEITKQNLVELKKEKNLLNSSIKNNISEVSKNLSKINWG
ncbi:MAG: hypothetical protein C4518_07170 [Desulfobacteraceae bacterium]|nr:MAG: hypothetical protein C4518_07170 [Desulfobacteraceae bacterium]